MSSSDSGGYYLLECIHPCFGRGEHVSFQKIHKENFVTIQIIFSRIFFQMCVNCKLNVKFCVLSTECRKHY